MYSTCKTAAAPLDSHNDLYSNSKKRKKVSLQLSLSFLTFFSEGGKNNINAAHWFLFISKLLTLFEWEGSAHV